jgi:hypothetical protein
MALVVVLLVMVAPYYRGRHIYIAAGQRDTCPYAGNSGDAAGNSHRPSGSVLERGENALAKLKI